MTRVWIGTALLAGSWVLGLDYFQPAQLGVWVGSLIVAVWLLGTLPVCWPSRRQMFAALVLTLPAVGLMPLPYKAIPLLLAVGLFAELTAFPPGSAHRIGRGAVGASFILLAQMLLLQLYASLTARSHELPCLLAGMVSVIPRLLGIDSAWDGSTVAIHSMQETYRIQATWELLLDPGTVCFAGGAIVVLALLAAARPEVNGKSWRADLATLLVLTLAWLPLRVAILFGLLLRRTLRADELTAPNVADLFVNSWLHLSLLTGLVLLASRFLARPKVAELQPTEILAESRPRTGVQGWLPGIASLLVACGAALGVMLLYAQAVGERQAGNVMVVERHSTWEPTTEPYGTKVYGEAGSYNYAAAYDYCNQYYAMSRLLETDTIDDKTLGRCNVLIVKTPTARYSSEEVAAVVRFVARGGSLLLIGDHTNVFNMNTYLNDIARHFGFTFRNDLLFRIGSPYRQAYRPPRLLAHPAVQHVPPMNFAVSCSIDPGLSAGRMVIRNSGLWNLMPAYHESNYHPQAEYRHDMQYGSWCQLWSTCYGKGRVLAFGDSTLFSNFCTFQPGKAQLLRGMIEWLNHRSPLDRYWTRLLVFLPCGLAVLLLFVNGLKIGHNVAPALLMAALLAGGSAGSLAVMVIHRTAMPVPPIQRPAIHVSIDRTLCEEPLFTGAFADSEEGVGYGMLEQWIPRVGNVIARQVGSDVFQGDAVVFICPTRSVSKEFRERLVQFVEAGGHALVIDTVEVQGSTANSLLWPFGLAVLHNAQTQPQGELRLANKGPRVPLQATCTIEGGTPLAWLGNVPAAAQVRYGKGLVTAIGFGGLFNDANMGFHWLSPPEEQTLQRYEVLYAILRLALPTSPAQPSGR